MGFFNDYFMKTRLTGNFAQMDQWDLVHIWGGNFCMEFSFLALDDY